MEAGTSTQTETVPMLSTRDWSDLPKDILSAIFSKLHPIDILMGAGIFVCHSWLDASMVPHLWRSVDMARHDLVDTMDKGVLCAIAKEAVDRSAGQLEVFAGKNFVNDDLLMYLGDRSASLKGLSLISCCDVSKNGFIQLITRSPDLEDISLELCPNIFGHEVYEAIGGTCPQLRRFSLHQVVREVDTDYWSSFISFDDESTGEALGITAMHELRSLSLIESDITNDQLAAILNNCPHLENLYLCNCCHLIRNDALQACARIKAVEIVDTDSDSD